MTHVRTQYKEVSTPPTLSKALLKALVQALAEFKPGLPTASRKIKARAIGAGRITDLEGPESWKVTDPHALAELEQVRVELVLTSAERRSCELHVEFRSGHIVLSVSDAETGWGKSVFEDMRILLKTLGISSTGLNERLRRAYGLLDIFQSVLLALAASIFAIWLASRATTYLFSSLALFVAGVMPALTRSFYFLSPPKKPRFSRKPSPGPEIFRGRRRRRCLLSSPACFNWPRRCLRLRGERSSMAYDLDTVRAALTASRARLLPQAHVVATGVGYKLTRGVRTDALSIVCSVIEKLPLGSLAPRERVPAAIDGIPTDVVATGVIRALQSRTARHRPAPGGVSIGHRSVTAGTLGCLVRREGRVFVLSNNHVLANSNDARRGDAILQPGPHDGGRFPDDHIAALEDFVPITFLEPPSECRFARGLVAVLNAACWTIRSNTRYRSVDVQAADNRVDAAIAKPLEPALVGSEILEIGLLSGLGNGTLGMAIKKSGRTTGLTMGEITQVDVTVNVQYGPGRLARFTDQLMAGPMSQGGDSGSAVLDAEHRLVGLLFAGSENSTIINRIEHVFSELGLSL